MPSSLSDVPTWKIFPVPNTGGYFCWIPVNFDSVNQEQKKIIDSRNVARRFPLDLDFSSGKNPEEDDSVLMFRTGSGNCVAEDESSIENAKASLGGERSGVDDGPIFCTETGNPVLLREHSIRKAEGILEADVDLPRFRTGSGKALAVRRSSIGKAEGIMEDNGDVHMFTTGSGRGVSARSSIWKATSSLGEERCSIGDQIGVSIIGKADEGCSEVDRARSLARNEGFEDGGGGRETVNGNADACQMPGGSVSVRQSSIRREAAILEEQSAENGVDAIAVPKHQMGFSTPFGIRQNSPQKAVSVFGVEEATNRGLIFDGGTDGGFPMFQTGSGKSVKIKPSSLKKVASMLGDDITNKGLAFPYDSVTVGGVSMFQNGSGKSITVKPSSIRKAESILEEDIIVRGDTTYNLKKQRMENLHNVPHYDISASGYSSSIKFQTASGRSLSIYHDALRRARNLLGESDLLHNDANTEFPSVSLPNEKSTSFVSLDTKVDTSLVTLNINICTDESLQNVKSISRPPCKRKQSFSSCFARDCQGIFFNQQELDDSLTEKIFKSSSNFAAPNPSNKGHYDSCKVLGNTIVSLQKKKSSKKQLDRVSNNIYVNTSSEKCFSGEKKRIGRKHFPTPFKMPRRSSWFTTPLNNCVSFLHGNDSFKPSMSKDSYLKPRISSRYPFQSKKKTLIEFFGGPPCNNNMNLSKEVMQMTADKADKYEFSRTSNLNKMGVESFQHMLLQLGASSAHITKEWVKNHYKWIVWKLACLERGYPTQATGKYLTANNVLEELKYRYEREVNCGHRSALKRILDGDASPAFMVVLCISAINSCCAPKKGNVCHKTTSSFDCGENLKRSDGPQSNLTKVELTDGWYSLNAVLDVGLSNHVLSGKLFIGQKLRIWGASLHGWAGPVSPFEASEAVSLLINLNGTYRTHWADRLGFCKNAGAPLSFNCIKGGGGPVPKTLVGLSRIYPILYKERFEHGSSVVRSERMERKILQLYNQRRANIAEDIMSEQRDVTVNYNDSEEGAKIFKVLQSSAEPEVLMAGMSSEQLASFCAYQARQQAISQSDLQKKIEKAVEDAGLVSRDVTPFIRVKVTGLNYKGNSRKNRLKEGLITIWKPTEKQKLDLVEGQIYSVSGLVPMNRASDFIYLQARGSTTGWKDIPSNEMFEEFFNPRKSVSLSHLGEVPLASEFDIAVVVLYLGEAYVSGGQKKQWIFVTDGSFSDPGSELERPFVGLLAISFCTPYTENDPPAFTNQALLGSIVCLFNLVKRPRDQFNNLWVAEATENSIYVFYHSLSTSSHLKEASHAVQEWAKKSSMIIRKLKERILCVIESCGRLGSR